MTKFEMTEVQGDEILSSNSGPLENQTTHVVEHLQDMGWIDNTANQDEDNYSTITKMLDIMQSHRDILKMEISKNVPPIMVHCSAGIGRTGTLCALFNMIESLRFAKANKVELEKVLQ